MGENDNINLADPFMPKIWSNNVSPHIKTAVRKPAPVNEQSFAVGKFNKD